MIGAVLASIFMLPKIPFVKLLDDDNEVAPELGLCPIGTVVGDADGSMTDELL